MGHRWCDNHRKEMEGAQLHKPHRFITLLPISKTYFSAKAMKKKKRKELLNSLKQRILMIPKKYLLERYGRFTKTSFHMHNKSAFMEEKIPSPEELTIDNAAVMSQVIIMINNNEIEAEQKRVEPIYMGICKNASKKSLFGGSVIIEETEGVLTAEIENCDVIVNQQPFPRFMPPSFGKEKNKSPRRFIEKMFRIFHKKFSMKKVLRFIGKFFWVLSIIANIIKIISII